MNLNISEAHKNEYNPLYYSGDSTKAALPSSVDITELRSKQRTCKGESMKCVKYASLHVYIQAISGVNFDTIDKLLPTLNGEDLNILSKVLTAYYEAGYTEGYAQGSEY